jgi:hypothetical protein
VALDWYILEADAHHKLRSRGPRRFRSLRVPKEPGSHTAMDEDTHHQLMSRSGNLPYLRRAANFYEDAVYDPADVEQLLSELISCGQHAAIDELVSLCREALHRRCGVIAIAD